MIKIIFLLILFINSTWGSLMFIEDSSTIGNRPCENIETCQPLAEQNEYARTTLGILYIEGIHNPKDIKQGLALLEKSANNKYGLAETILGQLYQSGNHVKQNNKISAKWYLK